MRVEGEIGCLKFRFAFDCTAECISRKIGKIHGVIEVFEMRRDIGSIKTVVRNRRNLDVGFDERTLDRARQLRGKRGNAVDGNCIEHRTRLEAVGRRLQFKVRSIAVDFDLAADVGELIVCGERGGELNFFVVESYGTVDGIDDCLLDANTAAGNI